MRLKSIIFLLIALLISRISSAQEASDVNKQLLLAAYNGEVVRVNQLLSDSADVNTRNDEGITPLMYAAEKGNTEIVKILLYNNADPNITPANGRTALISAAIQNRQDIVYLLLIYGANINATDESGVSALIYASCYNQYNMVQYLLKNGAQHVIKAQDGIDALSAASYFGNTDIVNLLFRNKADMNTRDYYGFTPLSLAIQNNDPVLCDSLIKYKSDLALHFKEYPRMTLVDYARIYNRKPIVKQLKKQGLHGTFWPFFNKITLNYNIGTFSTQDYYMGAGLGMYDSKYNYSLELGFNSRLAQKRILEPATEDIYYQLWEKRRYMYFGAEKLFNLGSKKYPDHRQGIYIRARGIFTYGSYEGLTRKPDSRFTFSPGLGYCYMFRNFFLKAGYEYCDLGIYRGMNHWITITAGATINLTKSRIHKEIHWI